MDFDTIVKKRKSIRSFTGKRVSWRDILDAIEAAAQGPFAGNINNLQFIIIEEHETINEISKMAEQTWINEANIAIVVCSNDTHLENIYGERGRVYSRQQSGAVIQSIMIKLVDLGLSSCWVGAFSDDDIKGLLSIPKNFQIEAIIPIGYENRKESKPRPLKIEIENLIRWEDWTNVKRPPLFKEPKDPHALAHY